MSRTARELRIVDVRNLRWLVESKRGDTANCYWVDPHRLFCECAAGIHGRHCAHLRFVLDALEGDARSAGRQGRK